jgi:hypothetical protein
MKNKNVTMGNLLNFRDPTDFEVIAVGYYMEDYYNAIKSVRRCLGAAFIAIALAGLFSIKSHKENEGVLVLISVVCLIVTAVFIKSTLMEKKELLCFKKGLFLVADGSLWSYPLTSISKDSVGVGFLQNTGILLENLFEIDKVGLKKKMSLILVYIPAGMFPTHTQFMKVFSQPMLDKVCC